MNRIDIASKKVDWQINNKISLITGIRNIIRMKIIGVIPIISVYLEPLVVPFFVMVLRIS